MHKKTCFECGRELEEGGDGLCKECEEMAEFFSHFTDEELEEAEQNVRHWVEQGCPIPAELLEAKIT